MKNLRRILAAALCAVMLLALFTGCGSRIENTSVKTSESSGNETKKDETVPEKPVEPVEIGFTFWEAGWDGPEDGKDVIVPEIAKRTGVKIKYESWKVTGIEDQKRQLGLWAASEDIPDVLFVPTDWSTVDLMNQMGDSDQLWDITAYLEKLEAGTRDIVVPTAKFFSSRNSGKAYLYPTQCSDYKYVAEYDNAQEGVIIRKDWLDKLGLGYPATPEEYYNVLKRFKTEIKAVNGQPVIPLLLGENLGMDHEIMKWFFDANDRYDDYSLFRRDANGQLTNAPIMEKLEAYVVFMNRLFRESLLDKESATLKDSQYQERMASGRVGSTGQVYWNMTSYNDNLKTSDPNALYVFMPMPKAPGANNPAQQFKGVGAPAGYVISKKLSSEKVDAVFKLLDFMSSKEGLILGLYGIEGQHWNYNADKKVEVTKDFLDRTKGDWNLGAHEGVGYYSQLGVSLNIVNDMLAPTPLSLRPDMIESRKNLKDTIFNAIEAQDLVPPGPVENKKLPAIRQAWRDVLIKAVISPSEEKCRQIINTWLDTWKKLGGEEIIKEKNQLVK